MSLPASQRQQYRAIAHHLNPAVTISENGVTAGVIAELERALTDHELIKIKLAINDREARVGVLEEICALTRSETVQKIGKTAVIFRQEAHPNPRLSNILRHQSNRL